MRDKLEEAVREHRDVQNDLTGYFLVTFSNGQAVVSGRSDADDSIAAAIIRILAEAMGQPDDAIGPCWGRA